MDIRNLGNFASIEAVWARYPNGGQEGDYLTIAGVKYRWNKYILKWENAEVVTETSGRESTTFSDLHIQNDVIVGGDVKVNGTLRAEHVKQPNVGLFATLAALQTAYPTPEVGMWAVVGNSVPGAVYRCTTEGVWSATGGTGGVDELENVLLYSQQTLNESQKAQARENIGAVSEDDLNKVPALGYYTCTTAVGTAAKAVSISGYSLQVGGAIKIKFNNSNTADDATLNIANTGAKPLFFNGRRASSTNAWSNNEIVEVYYDGTNYQARSTTGLVNKIESNGFFSLKNKSINKNTGAEYTAAAFCCTPFIPVEVGETVRVGGYTGGSNYVYSLLSFYKADKTFLSSVDSTLTAGPAEVEIVVPTNAAYMRCSSRQTLLSTSYVDCNALNKLFAIASEGLNMKVLIGYYECSTLAQNNVKVVSAIGYTLESGGAIKIKFTDGNTGNAPMLNINGTGAKALYLEGKPANQYNNWQAGDVLEVYYDGTYYQAHKVNVEASYKAEDKQLIGYINNQVYRQVVGKVYNPINYTFEAGKEYHIRITAPDAAFGGFCRGVRSDGTSDVFFNCSASAGGSSDYHVTPQYEYQCLYIQWQSSSAAEQVIVEVIDEDKYVRQSGMSDFLTAEQAGYVPSRFTFNGTSSYLTFDPITLSEDGDALDVEVEMDLAEAAITYGYPFTQSGANNGIGVAIGRNYAALRSDSNIWLMAASTNITPYKGTKARFTFSVKYENGHINVYVDEQLVDLGSGYTYANQEPITISGIGHGANGTYGYWKGILYAFSYTHSSVTKNLSELSPRMYNVATDTLKEQIEVKSTIYDSIRPMEYFAGKAPAAFIDKILAADDDVEVLLSGDSVTALVNGGNQLSNAANLPAGCQYDAITYQLWNAWCTNKPQCDRFDSQVNTFTEVGTWSVPNPEKFCNRTSTDPNYNGISSNGNKGEFSPANLVYKQSDSSNASLSFNFDTDSYEKFNFVYLKGLDGTTEATVSCATGKLQVYDIATGSWLEANGYTFSQSTLINGEVPSDANIHSHWVRNLALKFRKVSGVTGAVSVTIANTAGSGMLYYWGTERWSGVTLRVVNCGKAGRSTALLQKTINDDIELRKIDLFIWQVPVWNELKTGGDTSSYNAVHLTFLNTLKTLSANFTAFQGIVYFPHTQVQDWDGNKNLRFRANGLSDRPYTDLTSCECINKWMTAIRTFDTNVVVHNIGILVKDFANSIGLTMQDILYGNGEGEDTGDGTSVVVKQSDLFTVDGVHPTSTGYKFIANVIVPMIRV